MTNTISVVDTGTGYGRQPGTHNARLTEVGPGTPMGEALRRYWHPVACASALTSDLPHRAKVLGEDLIVFRDGQGQPGVVAERCAHRGSSLFYGRVEEDGIRCCYHGWKFDVRGHCLEQACEPDRGRRREAARQPWYPVEERYGLVFVYMGPPECKPPLPRFENLEDLQDGETIFTELPVPGMNVVGLLNECNWLQAFENAMDPMHATWLHNAHSGLQFENDGGPDAYPVSFWDPYAMAGKVTYEKSENGTYYSQPFSKEYPDGSVRHLEFRADVQLPNILALPDVVKLPIDERNDMLLWFVPSDDTSHRNFVAVRATSIDRLLRFILGIKQNGKFIFEVTEEEKQRYPSDFEAQMSQGPITLHSEETLATSDKGVVMLRRLLDQMVTDVEAGRDPMNIDRGEPQPRRIRAGVFTVEDPVARDTQTAAVS